MYTEILDALRRELPQGPAARIRVKEPLAPYTTLRVGGTADLYLAAHTRTELADVCGAAQRAGIPWVLLGGGSNVCISDAGCRGLVIHNLTSACSVGLDTCVDSGHSLHGLFLKSLAAGLGGLEFAVGIPGQVGGAMVSNAGAYRQNICDLVTSVEVVENGNRSVQPPQWMEFSYRDSRLRRNPHLQAAILGVTLQLHPAPRRSIRAKAAENQRQRIFKQPWLPSAGSFFKNVESRELAARVPGLPYPLREAGIVPAGFLSMACGCRGMRVGGAQISARHGNFVVNAGSASASDIRSLTERVKRRVQQEFGVLLEEEVLFTGDWSGWQSRHEVEA
jgi:UDP-N-acetylmuramate dehydrogenase